jgi:hypothetical protein
VVRVFFEATWYRGRVFVERHQACWSAADELRLIEERCEALADVVKFEDVGEVTR